MPPTGKYTSLPATGKRRTLTVLTFDRTSGLGFDCELSQHAGRIYLRRDDLRTLAALLTEIADELEARQ